MLAEASGDRVTAQILAKPKNLALLGDKVHPSLLTLEKIDFFRVRALQILMARDGQPTHLSQLFELASAFQSGTAPCLSQGWACLRTRPEWPYFVDSKGTE